VQSDCAKSRAFPQKAKRPHQEEPSKDRLISVGKKKKTHCQRGNGQIQNLLENAETRPTTRGVCSRRDGELNALGELERHRSQRGRKAESGRRALQKQVHDKLVNFGVEQRRSGGGADWGNSQKGIGRSLIEKTNLIKEREPNLGK